MWELTVIQYRGEYMKDEVKFESKDLNELTLTAIRLAQLENGKNTKFVIKYVEGGADNE